ncbi:MAG: L-threonylcarbamoyladenylate synthase [Candidatus Asgardarchaeia archaeon]
MVVIIKAPPSNKDYEIIKEAYDSGKLIVYPTDTVYGIGGNPYNIYAVQRVFEVKRRPLDKGLPLLSADLESIKSIVKLNEKALTIAKRFWPGALTIVAPLKDKRLRLVSGGSDKLGVRIPDDEITLELIKRIGKFIIGTSANISGEKPCIDSKCVLNQLGDTIDILIDAGIHGKGIPSTVIEVEDDEIKIIRRGALDIKAIINILEEK